MCRGCTSPEVELEAAGEAPAVLTPTQSESHKIMTRTMLRQNIYLFFSLTQARNNNNNNRSQGCPAILPGLAARNIQISFHRLAQLNIMIVLKVLIVLIVCSDVRRGCGGEGDCFLQLQSLPCPPVPLSTDLTVGRNVLEETYLLTITTTDCTALHCNHLITTIDGQCLWFLWLLLSPVGSQALLVPLCLYPLIDRVETLRLRAVAVIPEVTSQVVLFEQCPIRTKEGIFFPISATNMEHLRGESESV